MRRRWIKAETKEQGKSCQQDNSGKGSSKLKTVTVSCISYTHKPGMSIALTGTLTGMQQTNIYVLKGVIVDYALI